jgi:hypothetical protein
MYGLTWPGCAVISGKAAAGMKINADKSSIMINLRKTASPQG